MGTGIIIKAVQKNVFRDISKTHYYIVKMKHSKKYWIHFSIYCLATFMILWIITPKTKISSYKPKLEDISKYTYIDENNVCYKYVSNDIA